MNRVGRVYYWSLHDELWLVTAPATAQQAPHKWEMRSLETLGCSIWFTDDEVDSMMSRVT